MKKDQPRQDRRLRALNRLVIAPLSPHPPHYTPAQKAEREKLYAAYLVRKHEEEASLKRALGV